MRGVAQHGGGVGVVEGGDGVGVGEAWDGVIGRVTVEVGFVFVA